MSAPSTRPIITCYDDLDGVAHAAADLFVAQAAQVALAHRVFRVALSGGSTPRRFHTLLAAPPYRERVDWSQVQFYWGDERAVPPDDPESNYHMARETLLDALAISPAQIHRIPAEGSDHDAAAAAYEDELRRSFHLVGQYPRFDLIYLGMGDDGHTLSLFPHTAALHVRDRLVVANTAPKPPSARITLTAPVANNAAVVAFLIVGPDKADALAAVLEGPRDPDQYPAQLIAPTNGELRVLADRAATAKLTITG
ncbi:MAG: 6-phosphogluconolactonase [Ktedonobacterales bacterium]